MNWFKSFWKAMNTPATGGRRDSTEDFSDFTPRARQVLALAREQAARSKHDFVGTEHLLLGLIRLGQGTAVTVLGKMGLNLETVRLEVEKQIGMGPDHKLPSPIPYTPRVKKVLALAVKEAKALNHSYVGTEHILLGLLREGDGVAARVLQNLDVNIDQTRQEILKELDPNFRSAVADAKSSAMPQKAEPPRPRHDLIDTSKRYDVYCREEHQEVVVYRNVLFKGTKDLLPKSQHDIFSEYLEVEQADGQTVFIARASIIKFCEHGVTPKPEPPSRGGAS